MRRSALIAAVGIVLAVPVAPARAAGADVTVSNFSFTPASVNVDPGDSVTWKFTGPDTNHSTTSDAGQAESWDSDPGNPFPNHVVTDTFAHTFNQVGTYTYFCKVHTYMRARVVVGSGGSPPPSGGGGGGEPPPSGGGGSGTPPVTGDTVAPQLSSLKASVKRRRVTFKLDEPAKLAVKLRGPIRKNGTLNGKKGTNVYKLPARMKPGRYTLTLAATDAAGNKSPTAKVVVSVKR
jgi:plastocyanin